jgi:large subunit ribosomal protein L18
MKQAQKKLARRTRRHVRIRAKVSGDATRPRLAVYKSNRFMSVQVINDDLGTTIAAGSTKTLKGSTELEKASLLGKEIAKLAKAKGVEKVVFDRGGYIYTGKVRALADGAREGGLDF